jgi:hypothetical protein
MSDKELICQICGRSTPRRYQEDHHLRPGREDSACVDVCCDCGDQIHNMFKNYVLRKELDTLEKLLANEDIQKWTKFIRRKTEFGKVCMKQKKKKR